MTMHTGGRAERTLKQRVQLLFSISAVVVVAIAAIDRLSAHAGEDHGDASVVGSSPQSAGAALTVLKEQQFALAMLTELVAPRMVANRVEVTGRVVPRTDAVAEVVPGITGKVVAGRLPQRGERVARGQ